MVTEIRRSVRIQPGGRLEVTAPELREGDTAEVVIRVESGHAKRTAEEKLAALKRYQETNPITLEAAREWDRQVRLERKAWRPDESA